MFVSNVIRLQIGSATKTTEIGQEKFEKKTKRELRPTLRTMRRAPK